MDASIEQKQQFLRIEILEAGYDPQDFIQFMSCHTAIQSPTIQTLTMNQLRKVVEQYKDEVRRRNQENEPQNQDIKQSEKISEQGSQKSGKKIFTPARVKLLEQKKNKVQYDRYGTYDYELKGIVNCIQSEKILKVQKIQVTIPEMEAKEVEGFIFGFGAKTEYYYHIKTNLMKGTVKRLSQDFDWLNTTILKLFPLLMVPELQQVRKDIKDPYIKRQKQIQQYLQHLCEKRILAQSYLLIDFLTMSSEKMQKYKKAYDSMSFAKGVSLMKTEQGTVEIDLSNRTRDLYNNSKQFSRKTSQLHESISSAMQKMIESYRVAITDTYTVVDLFAQLHDVFSDISNKFPPLKKQEYNDTLVNLNNLFLGIGDNLKSITDTIQKNTKDYYRFYNGLDRNILKLQRMIKDSENEYLEFKTNLQRKKQRVITDPTKWDLEDKQIDPKKLTKEQLMKVILPKEVHAENEMKSWYAYNLKNYENQFVSYLRFITKRYQKVFRNLAVELLADDKGYLEAITKFISENRRSQAQIPNDLIKIQEK